MKKSKILHIQSQPGLPVKESKETKTIVLSSPFATTQDINGFYSEKVFGKQNCTKRKHPPSKFQATSQVSTLSSLSN